MMNTAPKVAIWLALGAMVAAASPGAEPAAGSAAGSAARFASESKILAAEVEEAAAAWIEQHALYEDLLAAARNLERLYADAAATAEQLRAAEDDYEAALDATVRQARRTIARRRAVYDAMEKVERLGRNVERDAVRKAEPAGAPEAEPTGAFGVLGAWLLDLDLGNGDLVGLMKLHGEGTLVSGTYRLSNGRSGSVSGTFVDGRLELTRVDSKSGRDLTLEATLDERNGELSGSWQKFDLGSGGPAGGRWTAARVAPGDELPDLGGE